MGAEKDLVRISKFLAKTLRHAPEQAGLTLDDAGWVKVSELRKALTRAGLDATTSQLDAVVHVDGKRRYEYSEDGKSIRAMQGHSVDVELGYEPVQPPAILYHGTHPGALDTVMRQGLRPMSRQHVHLSSDEETAKVVGARRGKPTLLLVDARAAHEAGYHFYLANNGVWLTNELPAKYLSFA